MRIHAKWEYYPDTDIHRKGLKYNCNLINIDFCCDDAKIAEREDFLHFGEYDSMLNRDANMNIIKCSPYPEGVVFDEEPIRYCPFCGVKILINVEE